jgi:potassium-transporting ATPase KdpC subunit
MRTLLISLRATVVTFLLTGFAYPMVVYGVGQVLFPARANGSLITGKDGTNVGSELIGQGFTAPGYFQGRPSAAGDKGFDATASSGSNLSPTAQRLRDRIQGDVTRLQHENPGASSLAIPSELVLASASGLDPEIGPESALWQVARVASARGVARDRVRALVDQATESRDLGILGEPRVNVLLLNLALDRQFGSLVVPPAQPPPPAQPTPSAALAP